MPPRLVAAEAFEQSPGLTANVAIDVARVRHSINPNIYGSFIEHIGRIIYGGIYEEGSKLSDENGFRTDVMNAARDWGVTSLRWPGRQLRLPIPLAGWYRSEKEPQALL